MRLADWWRRSHLWLKKPGSQIRVLSPRSAGAGTRDAASMNSSLPGPAEVCLAGENPLMIYPISYSIPEEYLVSTIPLKDQGFASLIPGKRETYIYGPGDEQQYHKDYQRSLFAITSRKDGWDCLRHYEILANGAVPYFIDLEECPLSTLTFLPKDLLLKAKRLPGVSLGSVDMRCFPISEYMDIADALLVHTRKHLTTKAMARYVLQVTGHANARSALFVTGKTIVGETSASHSCNYLRETIFHGMRSILGSGLVEIPKLTFMYQLPSGADVIAERSKLYGYGFSYALRLEDDVGPSREHIEDRIREREFDLVIYGCFAYDTRQGKEWPLPPPYWALVTKYYPPSCIIMLHGGDRKPFDERLNRRVENALREYAPQCQFFLRECY